MKESAEELLRRIASYSFTKFRTLPRGKWIYVKQITKKEYDKVPDGEARV